MSFGNRFAKAKPSEGRLFQLVPKGWYPVYLTETKMMKNSEGWEGVNVTAKIHGGEFDGRVIYHTFTIAMPKHEKGEEIAQDGMDGFVGLLAASGHPTPTDPDAHEIGGRLVGIDVYQKKQKGGDRDGEMKNDFSAWCPASEIAAKSAGASAGGNGTKKAAGKTSAFSKAAQRSNNKKEETDRAGSVGGDFDDDIPF